MLADLDPSNREPQLIAYLNQVHEQGGSALLLTWDLPLEEVRRIARRSQLPSERSFFIDCISNRTVGGIRFEQDAFIMDSPTELGRVILRTRSAIKRSTTPCHVMIHTLQGMATFNRPGPIAEFLVHLRESTAELGATFTVWTLTNEKGVRLAAPILERLESKA